MSTDTQRNQRGQVLVVMSLLTFFVFVGVSAVTVDLGNGYLEKRRLQNAADMAALAAGNVMVQPSGTTTLAKSEALEIVRRRLGASYEWPVTNEGSGVGLTNGIEFSGDSVRVALRKSTGTFFAGYFGVNEVTVATRARASMNADGVLPIAVKRWSDGDTSKLLTSAAGNPETVTDYLLPDASDTVGDWPDGWPGNITGNLYGGTARTWASDDSNHGEMMEILGQGALANVANGNDFHFFVAPDVRDITHTPATFMPPIEPSTSIQDLRDIESALFLARGFKGYPPYVGQQLGTMNGTATNFAVAAMKAAFPAGSRVVAMVYDGTVYGKPDFVVRVSPAVQQKTDNLSVASPIDYTVTIDETNNFNGTVQLTVVGLLEWADWEFISPATRHDLGGGAYRYDVVVTGSDVSLTLRVSGTVAREGARTALVQAFSPGTGILRTGNATVVVGDDVSFAVSSNEAFKVVEQGSSGRFDLDVKGYNGFDEWVNASYVASPLGVGPSFTGTISLSNSSVRARNNATGLRVNYSVPDTHSTGTWVVRLQLDDSDSAHDDQWIDLVLQVTVPSTGGTVANTTSYVNVLGYAAFIVDHYDTNTAFGYAVSGLYENPRDVGKGMAARLVGWSQ